MRHKLVQARQAAHRGQYSTFRVIETVVFGEETIVGAGEQVTDGVAGVHINFPLWFVEEPFLSVGPVLDFNEFVTVGQLPSLAHTVISWDIKLGERVTGGYWVGATVSVVTTGKVDQRIRMRWRAEGKAIQGPAQPEITT